MRILRSIAALVLIGSAPAAGQATPWDASMELIVNIEVARIEGSRIHRPYVAVWIEDQKKFPVRTIALWTEKPRYIPDLKAWYNDDETRFTAEGTPAPRVPPESTPSSGTVRTTKANP